MHLSRFAQKKYNELNEVLNCPIIIFNNWITFHNRFYAIRFWKHMKYELRRWENEMKVPPESSITSQEWINSIQKRFTMYYMMVTNPHIYTHPRFLWVNNERNVLPAFWPISLKMVFLDIHRLFLLFGQVQNSIHICLFKFSKDEFLF